MKTIIKLAYAATAPVIAATTAHQWLKDVDDPEHDDYTTAALLGVTVAVGWPLLASVRVLAHILHTVRNAS